MTTVTQKGQVTIPKAIRNKLHIVDGVTEVIFVERQGDILLQVVATNPFDALRGVCKGQGLDLTGDELIKLTRG